VGGRRPRAGAGSPATDRDAAGERGISRRELADVLGVHYQTVGYLERGE
jgi:hypothetical protein